MLHRPGTAGFRRLNAAMVLAGLAAFGLLYAAQPVLPEIGDDFGVGPAAASLTVSAATGALAIGVVPAAVVAARIGRLTTIRIGLVSAVLLSLAAAVAPAFWLLVALRAAIGLSLAAVVAVAMGHVGAEVHPRGLGGAMGLYVAGNTLGGVGGRLLVAGVSDVAGWRWGVAVLALAAGVVAAGFWRTVPEPVSGGVAPRRREHHPSLLRRPLVLLLAAVPFTLMGGFVAVYNYLGYRLAGPPYGLSPGVVGLVFLAYLSGTASSALAGRMVDRLGRLPVIVLSSAVMLVGLGISALAPLAAVVGGLVVFTAGFFGAHATASGWMPVVAAPDGARGSALYVGAYYAGSSIFGLLVGSAWSAAGWSGVALSVGALTVLGLGAAVAVGVACEDRFAVRLE